MHACYDRLVFDIAPGSSRLGYYVHYVDQVIRPGSGLPVPVNGGAKIQIEINAPSYLGMSTTNFPGWRTFRQLTYLGSVTAGTPPLRGLHRLRARRAGPAADAGLRAHQRRRRPASRRRRRPPLVGRRAHLESTAQAAPSVHIPFGAFNQAVPPRRGPITPTSACG